MYLTWGKSIPTLQLLTPHILEESEQRHWEKAQEGEPPKSTIGARSGNIRRENIMTTAVPQVLGHSNRTVRLASSRERNPQHRLGFWCFLAAIAAAVFAPIVRADPVAILFVGNSYTFGRVDPVLSYNAANVHDLTAAFNAVSPIGTNSFPVGTPGEGWFEQHPWGGVPGIFKKFTDEAGLNYDVSLSTRNAASLRGQFLNTNISATNPNGWDLRSNVASKRWDTVVLQEQSDAALPAGKGKNANLAYFNAYADKFEQFIHSGAAQTYTESALFGGPSTGTAAQRAALCVAATGSSVTTCNTVRTIPANPNADPATKVFLEQSWARPDMVYAHPITTPDITTADGRPIVDTSAAGGPAELYYAALEGMTTDLHTSFFNKAASNSNFAGVAPVGDAFMRAVQEGVAMRNPYNPGADANLLDLWWLDNTHASKYGSYLSALTLFGTITGLDPQSLGASEIAARELGISASSAFALQRIAAEQLGFPLAAVPEPSTAALFGCAVPLFIGWRRRLRGMGAPFPRLSSNTAGVCYNDVMRP